MPVPAFKAYRSRKVAPPVLNLGIDRFGQKTNPGTQGIGGWLSPRAGLNVFEKSY